MRFAWYVPENFTPEPIKEADVTSGVKIVGSLLYPVASCGVLAGAPTRSLVGTLTGALDTYQAGPAVSYDSVSALSRWLVGLAGYAE